MRVDSNAELTVFVKVALKATAETSWQGLPFGLPRVVATI